MKWIHTKLLVLCLNAIFTAYIITSESTFSQSHFYYSNHGTMNPPTKSWIETILFPALILTGLVVTYIVIINNKDNESLNGKIESGNEEKTEPVTTDSLLIKPDSVKVIGKTE